MKLSISNIAWSAEHDEEMYAFISQSGFSGLEIAPTRLFPEEPYARLAEIRDFSKRLYEKYGLKISSMQSIWFGKTQSIFGGEGERRELIDYTKRAVDFANAAGCGNLVFGCPKNRVIPDVGRVQEALEFFHEIGEYAAQGGTSLALEANPPIYNTNFMNTTPEAFDICKRTNSKGVSVNVDLGTIIYNNESLDCVRENLSLVNHIHISEPQLAPIEKRELHLQLKELGFDKFLSIEMGNKNDLGLVKSAVKYIAEVME